MTCSSKRARAQRRGSPTPPTSTPARGWSTTHGLYAQADIVVCVQPPAARTSLLRPGSYWSACCSPSSIRSWRPSLADAKVTAISLDGLPRTLSAAQSMDVLSSQANVAGYKAALVAADAYGGYLPMFMTAAGTTRPAQVLVIGAGVAGLQAIGTARRLGAVVTGYDVRDAARADVLSTGATLPRSRSTAVSAAATAATPANSPTTSGTPSRPP